MENDKSKRASKQELDIRVLTVQGWIINGVQDFLIKKQAVTQWGVSFKTAKRYLKLAFDELKPDLEKTVEVERSAMIAKLEERARTMEEKFKKTPLGIRALNDIDKMIIRLKAIEPPKKIQLQGDDEKPIHHKVQVTIVSTGKKIATSEEEVNV